MKTKIAVLLVGVAVVLGAVVYAQLPYSNYEAQGGTEWVMNGRVSVTQRYAVTLTSPTVTFSAASLPTRISLTSNANLTGIYPTGGHLGQRLEILSGSGSNTMRFDDGTSMTIGGNVTLTEAQNDILCIECIDTDGDEWMRVYSADN